MLQTCQAQAKAFSSAQGSWRLLTVPALGCCKRADSEQDESGYFKLGGASVITELIDQALPCRGATWCARLHSC